ncbi:MAG: DUF5680 domain-containing protein [Minisyncoccia bacterium]|jgi:hypothetical protein
MKSGKHLKIARNISKKEDKTKGYGSTKEKYEDFFLPRFKVIVYRKGHYLVVDRYTGDEQYIGESITLYRRRPIFGLNYYGKILDSKFKPRDVFDFLKKALVAGAGRTPYRGLDKFKENGFLYRNSFTEKRRIVKGEEKIFYKNKLIYIQAYHGGLIKDGRPYGKWKTKLLSPKELRKRMNSELNSKG